MPKLRNTKYYIGIDIGLHGAIVAQNSETTEISIDVMPILAGDLDLHELHSLLTYYKGKNCHVVFEDLHAIFGSSAGATFSFGGSAKATEMCCIALGLPFTKVKAIVWQKEMFVGISEVRKPGKTRQTKKGDTVNVKGRVDTKEMALLATKRLFPNTPLVKTERSKKPHTGIVDALLQSEYCKRHFK